MKRVFSAAGSLVVNGLVLIILVIATGASKQSELTTDQVSSITGSTASCVYSRALTLPNVANHGVCVNKLGNPDLGNKETQVFSGSDDTKGQPNSTKIRCSANMQRLAPSTKYYVRAYAKLSDGSVVYGNQKSFTTKAGK